MRFNTHTWAWAVRWALPWSIWPTLSYLCWWSIGWVRTVSHNPLWRARSGSEPAQCQGSKGSEKQKRWKISQNDKGKCETNASGNWHKRWAMMEPKIHVCERLFIVLCKNLQTCVKWKTVTWRTASAVVLQHPKKKWHLHMQLKL